MLLTLTLLYTIKANMKVHCASGKAEPTTNARITKSQFVLLTNTAKCNKLCHGSLVGDKQLLQSWNKLLLLKEKFGNCRPRDTS